MPGTEKACGTADPGTGGDSPKKDGAAQYKDFLDRMTAEQRRQWDEFYGPLSQAFYAKNYSGAALEIEMFQVKSAIGLRACCAMPGTDVGGMRLCACYAMPGTDVAYGATRCSCETTHSLYCRSTIASCASCLRACYAVPGTDVAYAGVIKPGSSARELALNLDYGATLCEVAGAKIPPEVQGESLLSVMKGTAGSAWRKSIYYHYYEFPGRCVLGFPAPSWSERVVWYKRSAGTDRVTSCSTRDARWY
eukprot:3295214-Rhodomonas_salina.3